MSHMTPPRVLIVDDEPGIRQSLSGILEDEGYAALTAGSGEDAMDLLESQSVEAILLDVWLPGIDGLCVLERIQGLCASTCPAVIMISGHASIESAVRATKLGAFDFLEKPLTIEKVLVVLKNALEQRRLRLELKARQAEEEHRYRILGDSVPMKALRQQITLMAATNGRVLIYGESGTGKEIIARTIHSQSPRADKPFIELNCAAIPEEQIEIELFGERRFGGISGQVENRQGKFEKADGGTLFLDEVGDMSLRTQAKVLRVLDEQRIEPVGSGEPLQVDVRVIASTNKNLDEEIERGNFREDLFYRLNVIPFEVPPLRERVEDVRLLARHFLDEFTSAYGRKPKELTEEACQVLEQYAWPGNIRELKNLMERIVIMYPQVRIDARHVPIPSERRKPAPAGRTASLQEVRTAAERDYILRRLDETGGNISRTAELLGLERSNLYRKMKALGITPRE
jgi:two-component system nitrogen regulation response regulator NtrX